MKNIITSISFIIAVAVLFSACDPTKDFTDQFNTYRDSVDNVASLQSSKVRFADTAKVYKLTDADYAKSLNSKVKSKKYFTDILPDTFPAKTNLTSLLNNTFIAKYGTQMTITYNYYNPLAIDSVKYTIADQEYGNASNSFSDSTSSILTGYLPKNYPTVKPGKIVNLTFKVSGTSYTRTFIYTGAEWAKVAPLLTPADHKAMGVANDWFLSADDAKLRIPVYMKTALMPYVYAKAGDKVFMYYDYPTHGKHNILQLVYDGTAWRVIESLTTATSSFTFSKSNVWNYMPPLKFVVVTEAATRTYTLTDDDYVFVGNGQYKDFDRRTSTNGPESNPDVLLSKIVSILKSRFADIASNQVFAVTFKDFLGGTSTNFVNATINVKAIPSN